MTEPPAGSSGVPSARGQNAAGVGDHYRATRLRLTTFLDGIDDDSWDRPVDACPGWRVRDVLAHLVATVDDAIAGRITGPPPPDLTADQVDRHRHDDPRELLAAWDVRAPRFEPVLTERRIWPAFFDVLSHEHDIRHALGRPAGHDSDDVRLAAELLTRSLPPGLTVDRDDASGGGAPGSGAPGGGAPGDDAPDGPVAGDGDPEGGARLVASSFDVFRLRLGRRSRAQVLAMDWTGDPEPFVDQLFVFGPRETDLIE